MRHVKKTVLIVGVDSSLGAFLESDFRYRGFNVVGTTRRRARINSGKFFLDLRLQSSYRNRRFRRFDTAIFCAGVTSISQCEAKPTLTSLVNVFGTLDLITNLLASGVHVVFLSTSLVLTGGSPQLSGVASSGSSTIYGQQKAAVERKLRFKGGVVTVVRISKVITPSFPLFQNWASSLLNGKSIHPYSTKLFSPVWAGFVSNVLQVIAASRWRGLVQISAARDITYADAARELAVQLASPIRLVNPISDPAELVNSRASFSFLMSRGVDKLGFSTPDPQEAIRKFACRVLKKLA